jgi:hypothetical protein
VEAVCYLIRHGFPQTLAGLTFWSPPYANTAVFDSVHPEVTSLRRNPATVTATPLGVAVERSSSHVSSISSSVVSDVKATEKSRIARGLEEERGRGQSLIIPTRVTNPNLKSLDLPAWGRDDDYLDDHPMPTRDLEAAAPFVDGQSVRDIVMHFRDQQWCTL